MPSPTNVARLYATLDAILDTRIGTIARLGPELVQPVLDAGYHNRDSDVFAGVDRIAYCNEYQKRDVETLKRSTVTNVPIQMKQLAAAMAEQAGSTPYHDAVEIVINLFPYTETLSVEERAEIEKACKVWFEPYAQVELVSLSLEQLTPTHCKTTYSGMFVYEYAEWTEIHTEAFKSCRLPEVQLFAPALYQERVPSPQELDEMIAESGHPMQSTELVFSPVIGLTLVKPEIYSIVRLPRSTPA